MAKELTKEQRLGRLRVLRAFFTLTLAFGVAIMLYPAGMRLLALYQNVQAAERYDRAVKQKPNEELEEAWRAAQAYNEAHATNVVGDPFTAEQLADLEDSGYADLLNPMGNGIMGYLDIPLIGQRLNVYHGTEKRALERGVGHLQGTSLPVGGASTHCVVSGHRGLPAAKIFTDLDKLKVGDVVYLHILDHTLAYAVDKVQVVLPSEIDALGIVEGQDLLTLVTCTPYAVNTHRLLVTCHSVPYVPEQDETGNVGLSVRVRLVLIALALVGCVVLAVVGIKGFAAARKLLSSRGPQPRHFA